MNRRIGAILAAALFGLGVAGGANGQTTPSTPSTPEKNKQTQPAPAEPTTPTTPEMGAPQPGDMQKTAGQADPMSGRHLALLNVYLGQAMLNAKALDSLSQMEVNPKGMEAKEVTRNLDMSVKNAMTHLGKIKKMNDPAFTRITELDRALKDVRTHVTKLKKAKQADVDAQIDQIGGSLTQAEQIFRDMAKTANFSVLEDQSLGGTVPVRGTEEGIQPQQPSTPNVAPPKQDTDMLPEPARPESPPSSPTPNYR